MGKTHQDEAISENAMTIRYFRPDILIAIRCEHCGNQGRETLAQLYSDARLACTACGSEHSHQRTHFRRNIDETEALVASVPGWTVKLLAWMRLS